MQIAERLKKVKLLFTPTREKIIGLIIVSLILFIAFSSIGGSKTGLFDFKQNSPEFQDNPQNLEMPNGQDGGFNLSQFGDPPDGFQPPSSLADQLGSGGIGGLPDIQDFNPGVPSGGGGGGGNPIPSNPPTNPPSVPPGNPPDIPDFPNQNNNGNNNNNNNQNQNPNNKEKPAGNSSQSPFQVPKRPNKARNLLNLSSIELFPNSDFSFSFGISAPQLPPMGVNNVLFAVIIFTMLYLPKSVVTRLLEETNGKDTEGDQNRTAIFFKPDEEEIKKKKERERLKKLNNLSDYLNSIVEEIQRRRDIMSPKEIMMWTYLQLDEAFAQFSNLKRDPSITPLEHAQKSFEDHEINNEELNSIVDLFYLTRFGNRDMREQNIDELIDSLNNLVIHDFTTEENNSKSRWRIF